MENQNVPTLQRPFQISDLLLSLPDHITKMVFNALSTRDAAILSAVNEYLRSFALGHTPASWVYITITLPKADKIQSVIVFLTRLASKAKKLSLLIDVDAIDHTYLQTFPVMPNVLCLWLSHNRWLLCDHLELLASHMPAVTQLRIDHCSGLKEDNQIPPTDRCLEIVNRHYGRQLISFDFGMITNVRKNNTNNSQYSYSDNMMVRLMSSLSNVSTFNLGSNAVLCPNPVIAGMLNRSPTISVFIYEYVAQDAETQTFMSALSSCRDLTFLSLIFGYFSRLLPMVPTTPRLKPSMFRTVFSGLPNLETLYLNLNNAFVEDEEGDAADGHHPNPPFRLERLAIWSRRNADNKLPPFLRRLVMSQIGGLHSLGLHMVVPDFTEFLIDLFARRKRPLRVLAVSNIDYSSTYFTPPKMGYLSILNRTPNLVRLTVKTKNKAPNHNDSEVELLEALAKAYPNCKVTIDNYSLSDERRRAIAPAAPMWCACDHCQSVLLQE